MSDLMPNDFANLYANFNTTITALDCGKKCGPYNENGVPFCCDVQHAIPTAYQQEWKYLQSNTSLWHEWEGVDQAETERLKVLTPDGQKLIACQGHRHCQRNFRSITCRAFPFYPYITRESEFIGLSYYWEYEDRCWVISHLSEVTPDYVKDFVTTYEWIFEKVPDEFNNFRSHSISMRRIFGRQQREIPLLHRDGGFFFVTPKDGSLKAINPSDFPKHGPYQVAAVMPFPDEA